MIGAKKGWNLVKHTLVEKEDWRNETTQGSLPKTISKTSLMSPLRKHLKPKKSLLETENSIDKEPILMINGILILSSID